MGSVFCGPVCLCSPLARQVLGSPPSADTSSPGNRGQISAQWPHLSLQSPCTRSSFVSARRGWSNTGVPAHPGASAVWWGPGDTPRDVLLVGHPSPAFSQAPSQRGSGQGLGAGGGWGNPVLGAERRAPSRFSLLGPAGLLPLEAALWGRCSRIRPRGPQPQLVLPKYSPTCWQSLTSSKGQWEWGGWVYSQG